MQNIEIKAKLIFYSISISLKSLLPYKPAFPRSSMEAEYISLFLEKIANEKKGKREYRRNQLLL